MDSKQFDKLRAEFEDAVAAHQKLIDNQKDYSEQINAARTRINTARAAVIDASKALTEIPGLKRRGRPLGSTNTKASRPKGKVVTGAELVAVVSDPTQKKRGRPKKVA